MNNGNESVHDPCWTPQNQSELFPDDPGKIEPMSFIDLLPDPIHWDLETQEKLVIALIAETWQNVTEIFQERLAYGKKPMKSEFQKDYEATLGWLLGYWKGTIPIDLVIAYENALQKQAFGNDSLAAVRSILATQPIAKDCEDLRLKLCGGVMFAERGAT